MKYSTAVKRFMTNTWLTKAETSDELSSIEMASTFWVDAKSDLASAGNDGSLFPSFIVISNAYNK